METDKDRQNEDDEVLHEAGRSDEADTEQQRLEMVKLLLSRGAELNKCNKEGNSALHQAARLGMGALVQALLGAGAAPNICNQASQLALHLACGSACGKEA